MTSANKIEIGQTILLNSCEQKLAHFVAKHRNGSNRHFNISNLKISAQSAHTVDLEGVAGEIAFARLFNVYPDLDTDRPPPHPMYDSVIEGGHRIDVKTTKYANGKLLVDARKGRKVEAVDFYALMTGEFPGPYTYRGMMSRKDLIIPTRIQELTASYRSYVAQQHELVAYPPSGATDLF